LLGIDLTAPWPWYVAGPLIGLFVPVLLLTGNKLFGISSNLRHVCAASVPFHAPFFRYDWRRAGSWNLMFAVGIVLGAVIAGLWLRDPNPIALTPAARASIAALGVSDFTGAVPQELFNWSALLTWRGLVMMIGGGALVGVGTAYAGGCTSGHAISGLADLQLPSLVAVIGFFAGGLLGTWVLLPLLLGA
jgi:uncharacterized protein